MSKKEAHTSASCRCDNGQGIGIQADGERPESEGVKCVGSSIRNRDKTGTSRPPKEGNLDPQVRSHVLSARGADTQLILNL